MKVYAFDVDETLEISHGPIRMEQLIELSHHNQGHIVGLCGNYAMVTRNAPFWYKYISFIGPMEMTKCGFLMQLMTYIPAEEYIMVGNIKGVTGQSDDKGAADAARWRFICEREFAEGVR